MYDRLFSVFGKLQFGRGSAQGARARRTSALAGPPYTITNLEAAIARRSKFVTNGYPTAVNNAGRIAYYGTCDCDPDGTGGNLGYVVDSGGKLYATLLPGGPPSDEPNVLPYAVSEIGNAAGVYGTMSLVGYETWTANGSILYADDDGEAPPGSFALAINAHNQAVGQAVFNGRSAAALFAPYPFIGSNITTLLPPKNTSWIGTATGIDDSGAIVGYATFANQTGGRAVRFFADSNAVVLPVAAAGVSSSAQAINQKGDIVGNAGDRAFLYKNNRVTYLPRPPGEESGNAVAFAINGSDEIVGDIISNSGNTAFLYVAGKSYDLNSLLPANSGWQIVHAAGINDSGEIVGSGNQGSYSMKPQLAKASAALRFQRF